MAPHLHYQLQRGEDWEFADGLPAVFQGMEGLLTPGTYFSSPK